MKYYDGEGEVSKARAPGLAEMAFALGEVAAGHILACWFEDGDGVEQDIDKALDLYVQAAEKGDPFACNRLAEAYEAGQLGLPKDAQLAKKYRAMFNTSLD